MQRGSTTKNFRLTKPAIQAEHIETGLALGLRGDRPELRHPDLGSFFPATPAGRLELNSLVAKHFPHGAPIEIVRRDA
jgi:hypothetical protein